MRAPAAALAVLALALLTAPAAARAAPPSSGLEGLGHTVSDARLAEMRGKFVGPENVSYFGVQLQSSWLGPDGVSTAASLLFAVDFANGAGNPDGAAPRLLIGYDRGGDPTVELPGLPPGYVAVAVPAGLGGTQGAVQSQQIAGDDNDVRNDMRLAIVPAGLLQEADGAGLTEVEGGQAVQFADGDALRFIVADNQVGLELAGDGEGLRQSFDGAAGQAAQHALLASSGNTISNGMDIVIGFEALDQTGRIGVQNAMSAMKGLGF